ncbi:unnamed protein product, partial [Rangifer tarandus platyrhynchus]
RRRRQGRLWAEMHGDSAPEVAGLAAPEAGCTEGRRAQESRSGCPSVFSWKVPAG